MLIERRSRRKLQRLFISQTKDPKHAQTVVQQIVNPRLQIFIEIDQVNKQEDRVFERAYFKVRNVTEYKTENNHGGK